MSLNAEPIANSGGLESCHVVAAQEGGGLCKPTGSFTWKLLNLIPWQFFGLMSLHRKASRASQSKTVAVNMTVTATEA